MEPYEDTRVPVCHFDLYRLSDPGEVEFLGVDECFAAGRLCLVEWPDRGAGCIPPADLVMRLSGHERGRNLHWQASGQAGRQLAASLSQDWFTT
jgi:tRNA threonylcarbamoyladenosine biosynthesis protein TsaE